MLPAKPRLLVLQPLTQGAMQRLATHHDLFGPLGSVEETLAATDVSDIRAVLTNGSTGLSAAQMARLPALEIVCAFGAGYENIDLAAAARRGVTVTHAPGANDATVADHAVGMMLALARGFVALDAAVRAGAWNSARAERPTLSGARLGLIGMGRIGARIATRAAAFDMQIAYVARSPRPDVQWRHEGDLLRLARESDYLVAACPGGPGTRHLVDAAVLAALGNGFLVNIARGSVVDNQALIAALEAGSLGGAALDVFEDEPEVPARLRACPNTLFTPHIAGRSPAAIATQVGILEAALAAHAAGRPPENRLA